MPDEETKMKIESFARLPPEDRPWQMLEGLFPTPRSEAGLATRAELIIARCR